MPYIGNIVQDFSVNTAMLNSDSVTSIKIDDGTIVNADINDSAAIDVSKLSGVLPLAGGTLTGDLTLSGTAPKIVFTDTNNDPDYQFKVDSGVFTLERTAGNDQFRFNADGSFFLGGNFNTNSLISGANGLAIEGAATFNDAGADVDFRVEGDTEPNLLFVDASADQVSIGTSSPSDVFDVVHAANAAAGISIRNTNNTQGSAMAQLLVSGGDASKGRVKIETNGAFHTIDEDSNGNLIIEDNGTEALRIDSSRRVLIGHSSNFSGYALQVLGGDEENSSLSLARFKANASSSVLEFNKSRNNGIGSNTVVQNNDAVGVIRFKAADGTDFSQVADIQAAIDGTPGDNDTPGRLVFSTTADGAQYTTERMRIDSSGNVGIGTTSPSTNLHVKGPDGAAPKITLSEGTPESAIRSTASGTSSDLRLMTSVSGTQTTKLIVDYSGNVGIGTTSPQGKFHVKLATDKHIVFNPSQGEVGNVPCIVPVNDSSALTDLGFRANHLNFAAGTGAQSSVQKMTIDDTGVAIGAGNIDATGLLHIKCGADKNIVYAGNIGEIGDLAGFQATNDASNGLVGFGVRASEIRFAINNSEEFRITDNGVTFNGDTASANALDDYEEGSWTPNVNDGATSVTYSEQHGRYVKIGKMVTLSCRMRFTGTAEDAGFRVGGLPFTAISGNGENYTSGGITYTDLSLNFREFDPYINAGHNYVSFYRVGSGDLIKLSGNATNKFMGFSAVYFV